MSKCLKEKFEDTKWVIRRLKTEKKKKKRTNNNVQYITQKTKDRATRTPLKTDHMTMMISLPVDPQVISGEYLERNQLKQSIVVYVS